MIVASESGFRVARRASSSSSETPAPSCLRSSMMPSSKHQVRVQVGMSTATSSYVFLLDSFSTKIATAAESLSIHWICSADEVS